MIRHRVPAAPPERLDAAYHLLDRQILDSHDRCVAKVDDLELVEDADGRLYVTALLVGPGALGPRLKGRLGAATVAIWRRLSNDEAPGPGRIGIAEVVGVGSAVHLACTRADVDVEGFERWADDMVVSRLPWHRRPSSTLSEPRRARPPDTSADRPLRMSDLLQRRVRNEAGQPVGHVSDVRLRTHFVDGGSRWHSERFEVVELIVNQRALATLLGYERRHDQGPWLLRGLLRRFRPPAAGTLAWTAADVQWEKRHVTAATPALDPFVP